MKSFLISLTALLLCVSNGSCTQAPQDSPDPLLLLEGWDEVAVSEEGDVILEDGDDIYAQQEEAAAQASAARTLSEASDTWYDAEAISAAIERDRTAQNREIRATAYAGDTQRSADDVRTAAIRTDNAAAHAANAMSTENRAEENARPDLQPKNSAAEVQLFPDENFNAYLVARFDKNGDRRISAEEAAAITAIDCSDMNIQSLEGIQYCTALKTLKCQYNWLTTLDVSKNALLEELSCYHNPLERLTLGDVNPSYYSPGIGSRPYPYFAGGLLGASIKFKIVSNKITQLDVTANNLQALDVTECPALRTLYCQNNQTATLDVSRNLRLSELACQNNRLTSLDVTKNKMLETLDCDNNRITNLDVTKNKLLTTLHCDGNNQLTALNICGCTALKVLHCCNNSQLTRLDVTGCAALETLYCCSNNQLTTLDASGCTALDTLHCYANPLEVLNLGDGCPSIYYYSPDSFKDYPYFYDGALGASARFKIVGTKIKKLDVRGNNLQALDVTECPALEYLECNRNRLTSLDLSKNAALEYLWCYNNELTTLNVSGCKALKTLYCSNNQLTTLDLSTTDLGNSDAGHSLRCSPMPTLRALYLKTGWTMRGITYDRSAAYIPAQTEILYKN